MILPVVIGQQPAAKENLQCQFADTPSGSSSQSIGENTDFEIESDKISDSSQIQNSSTPKETFSEKLKKAIAAVSVSDSAETSPNTNQSVSQQDGSNTEAVIPTMTGLMDPATENPEILTSTDSIEKIPENTSTAEMPAVDAPDISAANPVAIPPIETAKLSPVNENTLTPVDNSINQEPFFIKSDILNSDTNIDIQTVPEKYADAGVGAGVSDKNFQNSPTIEPAGNLTTAGDAQKNQNSTTNIKTESPEPLQQTIAVTKDSTVIKTSDTVAKNQNTVSNQNFAQKINNPQPQTNTENSAQTSSDQNFSMKQGLNTYQKTESTDNISSENKNSNDLQTLQIQETKTAGNSEKISSPTAADLKTDIKQETGEISRQIADSIKSASNNGEKEITVRLNPAELGKVVIKVSGEHSQISTIIEASNPATKSQLQDAFGQVAKNLADAGITLRHFEVRSASPSSGGFESAFSQSGHSGQSSNGSAGQFFQSQNPTEGGFYYQNQNFAVQNSSSEQNFSQNYFTARSVNMLA